VAWPPTGSIFCHVSDSGSSLAWWCSRATYDRPIPVAPPRAGDVAGVAVKIHLFQRLYGIPDLSAVEVERLLSEFRLQDRTRFEDGTFSTLELSGGQRKRLALVVSLLEQRPILLLDGWTAEQDPEFRRKFYDEVLPSLKRAGTTVVMVTHDSSYLDTLTLPVRRLHMNEGRFVGRPEGRAADEG
jgi:ABC-type siderophore export system fused ATPase/permease subunit